MVDIIGATLKPYNTYLAERENAEGDIETLVGLDDGGEVKVNAPGHRIMTVPDSASDEDKFYENIVVTNPTSVSGYAIRFASNRHEGQFSSGRNEISDALFARYADVTNGSAYLRWNVLISPLKEGSGITGAPTDTQSFYMVIGEDNPQNRWANSSWQRETRLMGSGVGGWHMVAETQDFTSLLGNTRVGYNIHFGHVIGKSPYSDTVIKRHAKFYNGYMINPNSIAVGGFGYHAYGYRKFLVDIAISAAGTGYTVGDVLIFDTGLDQNQNENSAVKVTAVNGSGGVTAANLWKAGSYTTNPAATADVTGGTGTGAQFTWTMSTESDERPRAAFGGAGRWEYGINFAQGITAYHLTTSSGYNVMLANNEGLGARNAANNADIAIAKVNTSDQVELAGKVVLPWATFTPTVDGDAATAFTSSAVVSASYARINDTVHFQVLFTITTKGAATFINVTPPVATTAAILAIGRNVTTGVMLSGYQAAGGTKMRFATYNAGDPAADATSYIFSGSYRVS